MSVCDTCPQPGHCCRSITLGGGSFAQNCQTHDQAEAWMRHAHDGTNADGRFVAGNPMPFHPLFKRAMDGAWLWWCPNLNRETGRCDDYENRPFCCSDYEPKTDGLCVLYEGEA